MTQDGDGLPSVVRCEGAPRDLGLDQAEACAAALRSPHAALGATPSPPLLERDLRRHYPQLAERLEGLARGARIPARILFAALAREAGFLPQQEPPATRAAVLWGFKAAWTGNGATLAWAARDVPWRLRESRPENGLASLEIVVPWLPAGVAGVNAAGLAVACSTLPAPLAPSACTAPAFLLVQECLQRFESVEGVEEWCLHRPAGGRATILMADAAGTLSGVDIAGGRRERLVPQNGILASPDLPVHRSQSAAKSMAASGLDGPSRLRLLLQQARSQFLSSPAERRIWAVALDARARRLWMEGEQASLHAFDVASQPRALLPS